MISLKENHIKTLYDYKFQLAVVQFNILVHDLKHKYDAEKQPNETPPLSDFELLDQPSSLKNTNECVQNSKWPEKFKFPSHKLNMLMRQMLSDPKEELSNFTIREIVNALFDQLWSMNITHPSTNELSQVCNSVTDEYPKLVNFKFDVVIRKVPKTLGFRVNKPLLKFSNLY